MKKHELFEKCERLEQHVRSRHLATQEELAQYRPVRGKRAPIDDWIYWYAQLVSFCRRMETRDVDAPEADIKGLSILREEPISVEVSTGDTFLVHQKSLEALMLIQALDAQITWMLARYSVLREQPETPEHLTIIEQAALALAEREQLIMWIVTHPGADIPPELEGEEPPIPDSIRNLTAVDRMRIYQAFVQLNAADLQVLERLTTPTRADGSGRSSWATLVATLAMKWGGDVRRITRKTGLLSLLATVQLSKPAEPEPEGGLE